MFVWLIELLVDKNILKLIFAKIIKGLTYLFQVNIIIIKLNVKVTFSTLQ